MANKRSIVPLNTVSEAFDLFNRLLVPFVIDARGEKVYFDIGDYVHLMDDEERIARIRWIAETLINPMEIRRGHLKSKPFREIYIASSWCKTSWPGSHARRFSGVGAASAEFRTENYLR